MLYKSVLILYLNQLYHFPQFNQLCFCLQWTSLSGLVNKTPITLLPHSFKLMGKIQDSRLLLLYGFACRTSEKFSAFPSCSL